MKRPRKYPVKYSCIYHSDEDVKDKGLTIGMLMAILWFFVFTYGLVMIDHYYASISEFFNGIGYGILKFFWI